MEKQKEKVKKANIYQIAGKVGKGLRSVSKYALGAGLTLAVTKGPDLIKKIKK